jgi:hypothetical protein
MEDQVDFPHFFAEAPSITLRDPLMVALGASADGIVTYGYADAVKLAGHSCPTVAGAWLMLHRGLALLHGGETPERGAIEVWMRDRPDEGTTGVIAAVATLVTGAAAESGFAGIGARRRFARRDLLHFAAPIDGLMALSRRDTGRGVALSLDTGAVPADAALAPLFARFAAGLASAGEEARFGALWQDRVRRMLTQHADDPALVGARDWKQAA